MTDEVFRRDIENALFLQFPGLLPLSFTRLRGSSLPEGALLCQTKAATLRNTSSTASGPPSPIGEGKLKLTPGDSVMPGRGVWFDKKPEYHFALLFCESHPQSVGALLQPRPKKQENQKKQLAVQHK